MAFAAVDCAADEVPALQLAPLPSPRFNGELAFQAAHSTPSDEVRRPPSWPREHLFEKALTPSDVGLLNRLVVPKQHAEKHFYRLKRTPMMAAAMGVLLEFKDGEGKAWRFRYSYCANSRIYVITKGWRRFVREKGLQAGDTVAFSRSAIGSSSFRDELHIDYWKKKTHKKQQEDTTTTADVVSVDSRVVMLFGVDIARGEHGQQCRHRQGPELAIA